MDSIWNVFRRWRKGRTVPDPERPTEQTSPVGEGFRPASWVREQALDVVLAETEGLQGGHPDLLECYLRTEAAPLLEQEQTLVRFLLAREWRWLQLESWSDTFAARQQWPETWQRFPSLIVPCQSAPSDVAGAVGYLSYLEMRDLLRSVWPHRSGLPLKVEDLQSAFVSQVGWDQVAELSLQRHRERVAEALASSATDRARLFCQHLTATANALMTYHQWQRIRSNQFLAYRLQVTCPEDAFASLPFRDRFNHGDQGALPPFFPGDSCRLQLARESSPPGEAAAPKR